MCICKSMFCVYMSCIHISICIYIYISQHVWYRMIVTLIRDGCLSRNYCLLDLTENSAFHEGRVDFSGTSSVIANVIVIQKIYIYKKIAAVIRFRLVIRPSVISARLEAYGSDKWSFRRRTKRGLLLYPRRRTRSSRPRVWIVCRIVVIYTHNQRN